jgi:hypothetical protein
MSVPGKPSVAPKFAGYHPADVFTALGADLPRLALFTTFTFSPGTFQQQYLTPLLHRGCGDITVLADALGYAQSLFGAAAVQGIGTDYRLRQVAADGAFHAKLVLVRTSRSAILGVGSGNLTTSGLEANAEVGALYCVEQSEQLAAIDNLVLRLRTMALLEGQAESPTVPIPLAEDARLVTSLDAPIFDQLDLPADVRCIEIVSPFIDGQQEVLAAMRRRWPDAHIRLRVDPGFGSLSDSLLASRDDRTDILVPNEPTGDQKGPRRPAVHGKLLCFIGDTTATAVLGSANLSRPALLTKENVEAVVERRLPSHVIRNLLTTPRIRWRKARPGDRRNVRRKAPPRSSEALIALVTAHHLQLSWSCRGASTGLVRVFCRGRCVFEKRFELVATTAGRHCLNVEVNQEVMEALPRPCFAEVVLDDGHILRGWIEVTDMLGLAPEAKRQLVLVDSIASDPLECVEEDVVKFIELLQRNLRSRGKEHFAGASGSAQDGNPVKEYEETSIERRTLLETGEGADNSQSVALSRLVNRTLDTALRDLRFFGRDESGRQPPMTESSERGTRKRPEEHDANEQTSLPPTIETVLGELFGQLAAALDAAESPREVANLIAQIPTCLKGLAYAAERWIPQSLRGDLLRQYFHKVVVACLAPSRNSVLCREGAVRRLGSTNREDPAGGPEFALGVAALEAYLLQDFLAGPWPDGSFMKDLLDVLHDLPAPTPETLAAAGRELARLRCSGEVNEAPDYERLRSDTRGVTGELAAQRGCRAALHELVTLVSRGVRDPTALRPLAISARGSAGVDALLELVSASRGRVTLVEVVSDGDTCPACHTRLPLVALSLLKNVSNVYRCSNCGVLLVRSLEL